MFPTVLDILVFVVGESIKSISFNSRLLLTTYFPSRPAGPSLRNMALPNLDAHTTIIRLYCKSVNSFVKPHSNDI